MTLSRKQFLAGLAGAAVGGTALAFTATPSQAAVGLHSACAARRVNIDGWYRPVCPGCGWKGLTYPTYDPADSDARRHRKNGWTN